MPCFNSKVIEIFDAYRPQSAVDHFKRWAKDLSATEMKHRKILRRAMTENGFKPHAEEWWHFSLENEPYPDTYFDFPITMPTKNDQGR